jgi:energy-coupling factor transporter ATP-binding protein EcfA2
MNASVLEKPNIPEYDTTVASLRLGKDERGVIVGRSGTGKSTLAGQLIPRTGNLCIIDAKRLFECPLTDIQIIESAGELRWKKPLRFMYRPRPSNLNNLADYDIVYRYCYDKGNVFVYTDDTIGIMRGNRYPHFFQVCYQMGRAKNVACLSCTQRPVNVPGFMISECTRFYLFGLNKLDDIKRVQEMVPSYDPSQFTGPFDFLFDDLKTRKPGRVLRIDLAGR